VLDANNFYNFRATNLNLTVNAGDQLQISVTTPVMVSAPGNTWVTGHAIVDY